MLFTFPLFDDHLQLLLVILICAHERPAPFVVFVHRQHLCVLFEKNHLDGTGRELIEVNFKPVTDSDQFKQ